MLQSSRLLRPLLFLCVQSREINRFRWGYPLLWLGLTALYLVLLPGTVVEKIDIAEQLVGSSSQLLMILPGFYIAALAAIATFPGSSMDQGLEGSEARLKSREHGADLERKLPRRHFLCLLFGYLSFSSLILALLCELPPSLAPARFFQDAAWSNLCRIVCTGVYGLFFLQLISLTLLGLFYLSDRIHWKRETYR